MTTTSTLAVRPLAGRAGDATSRIPNIRLSRAPYFARPTEIRHLVAGPRPARIGWAGRGTPPS